MHIELKVILDLRYYSVFGVNLLCMEKRINMQSVSGEKMDGKLGQGREQNVSDWEKQTR